MASAPKMTHTLRVLAHLLRYPDAPLRAHLPELGAALRAERALSEPRLAELETLIARLMTAPAMHTEATYVDLFDRGRGTSLHLFEHVHGDSRDRGPAMVDLIKTYEAAGLLLAPGELPDHLAVVLEYASTQPPRAAREFLGEIAHIVHAICNALRKRRSPYAHVLAAVLELAGEPAADAAEPIDVADELPLDETWEEPAAFGGCSSAGQAKPNQPQPIRIVRPAQGVSLTSGARVGLEADAVWVARGMPRETPPSPPTPLPEGEGLCIPLPPGEGPRVRDSLPQVSNARATGA